MRRILYAVLFVLASCLPASAQKAVCGFAEGSPGWLFITSEPTDNYVLTYNATENCAYWEAAGGGGGSTDFADLTTGTNTSATMTVGTGASLTTSGSGTITATTATALAANGANCAANSFPLGVDASGAVESCSTSISGNAATATALAANGANCAAGQFPLGVNASGAVESCSTSLSGNAATATALAANGANCAANSFPLGVDASGAVESCSTNISGNAATATALAADAANCPAGYGAGGVNASGEAQDCVAFVTGAESGGGLQDIGGELAIAECSSNQLMRDAGTATWSCTTGFEVDGSANVDGATFTASDRMTADEFELVDSDSHDTCSAGEYFIFADTSETKLKKCQNGTATDLDTTGGSPSFDAITTGTNTTATMTVGTGASLTTSGSGTITATTAGALAADPANCSTGQVPRGVAANGAVQNCSAFLESVYPGGGLQLVSSTYAAVKDCATGQVIVDGGTTTYNCSTGFSIDGSGNVEAATLLADSVEADSATLGSPLASIGALQIEGPAASDSGPHVGGFVSTDTTYPVYHLYGANHDDVGLWFDAYESTLGVVSSDSGSNFGIIKTSDEMRIVSNTGTSAGSTFSPTTVLAVQASGGARYTGAYSHTDDLATKGDVDGEVSYVLQFNSATRQSANLTTQYFFVDSATGSTAEALNRVTVPASCSVRKLVARFQTGFGAGNVPTGDTYTIAFRKNGSGTGEITCAATAGEEGCSNLSPTPLSLTEGTDYVTVGWTCTGTCTSTTGQKARVIAYCKS